MAVKSVGTLKPQVAQMLPNIARNCDEGFPRHWWNRKVHELQDLLEELEGETLKKRNRDIPGLHDKIILDTD